MRAQRFIERVNERNADTISIPLDDPERCAEMVQSWWVEVLGLGERQLRAKLAGIDAEEPGWDPDVLVAQMAAAMGR